jgi:hypothetical protein
VVLLSQYYKGGIDMSAPMLHEDNFNELIARRGRPTQWKEAVICTCWHIDSGQPDYNCEVCKGKGYIYSESIGAKALVTSLTFNKEWNEMSGAFEVGDGIMTIPAKIPAVVENNIVKEWKANPMYDIGENDHIILMDDTFKASEVLLKGRGMYGREADTLYNEIVTHVKYIWSYNNATKEIINYRETVDYTISENHIQWLDSELTPADATPYSVVYFHRPMYVVIANLPKPRHQDGQDLPRYVAIRYLSGAIQK